MSAATSKQASDRAALDLWAAELVADWPPLSDEQRDRLSAIISAGGGAR